MNRYHENPDTAVPRDVTATASTAMAKAPALIEPQPRIPIRIRAATPDDFEYIDTLQKGHSSMLGFMHRRTIETYISRGDILIAEEVVSDQPSAISEQLDAESRPLNAERCVTAARHPIGYCMGRDRYFKRDDVGIIYQLVVEPGQRRALVGAMLVQAMFERAAYGCRLFCCWCAQDLDANHFWESIGFVPLAFRTGSAARGQARIHIFWQKRIRQGDHETPWWFPSQTSGGAIRADRLVIPIPIGTHWRDAKPIILPGEGTNTAEPAMLEAQGDDDAKDAGQSTRRRRKKKDDAGRAGTAGEMTGARQRSVGMTGGLHFGPSAEEIAQQKQREAEYALRKKEARAAKRKRAQRKNNPKYVAAARELRDRFIEEVQAHPELLEGLTDGGKYDLNRSLHLEQTDHGKMTFAGHRTMT